jgi:acetoin utilization deacetylase AcuC-like enzyme
MGKTGFIVSGRYLEHDTGQHHPECAGRIKAICQGIKEASLNSRTVLLNPEQADVSHIQRVHAGEYINEFRFACESGAGFIDSHECPVSAASYEVALLAVGGTLQAVDAVMTGQISNAFCAVRPPGHHAERAHAMGFCYFNNVAIAAEYLKAHYNLQRIAILDFDVHHGNGTQHHFEKDPAVFYGSIHQNPRTIFPGTGFEHEVGVGDGTGTILNVPVMPGSGDEEYKQAFEQKIIPALQQYRPEFLLLSAGFDAHERDPLAYVMLSDDGFAMMTRQLRALAEEVCDGRLVSVLEGGYDFPALSTSVTTHLELLT